MTDSRKDHALPDEVGFARSPAPARTLVGMDQLSVLAKDIQERLRTLEPGTVLALWADGTFTIERSATRGAPGRSASTTGPVSTFAPAWAEATVADISRQLREASARFDA